MLDTPVHNHFEQDKQNKHIDWHLFTVMICLISQISQDYNEYIHPLPTWTCWLLYQVYETEIIQKSMC